MPEQNKKHKRFVVLPIYLSLSLCLALVLAGGYFLYNNFLKERTITVIGSSTSKVKNQMATFSVTVQTNDEDKQTAVSAASSKSEKVVNAVKDFGIPAEDLETTNLNVYQNQEPVLEKGVQVYRPGQWYASYTVNVMLRDLSKSTELTKLLTSFENTSLYGPNMKIDSSSVVDEGALLQEAFLDAKAKAVKVAKKAGRSLGPVLRIQEAFSSVLPIEMIKASGGMGGGGNFPIEAGNTGVQKSVVVTFNLR